jgi:hypothetical protein
MNLSEYKDIIKQAIANEVEARKFYDDASNTLSDPHLKKLFASLGRGGEETPGYPDQIYTSNTMDRYFSEPGITRWLKPSTSRNCPWR